MGLLSSVPGVGVRRVRRPMASGAVVAGTRIQRLLAGRAAAPALVLLIVTLTALAAIVPLGVKGSADPPLALAAEAHGGSVAAAPLGSSTRSEAMDADVTRLTLSDTSQGAFVDPLAAGGVAGLVLGAEGSLIKPVIPASRAPGVAPVVERYRAVRGDSLWSISRRFGTDTMSLWWANVDRLRDGLKVGHLLLIPPGHGVLHSVVQGDTLGTISARYRSSPASIIKANALRGEVVILGQLLLIPDGRGPSYPRGLLPGRPAMGSTRPVDSVPGAVLAPRTIGARDGFDGSSERGATDTLLAGGALRYGDLVAGNLASTASRPGTAAVGGGTPGRGDDGPSARTTANGTADPGDDQTAGTSGSTGMTGVGGTFETPKGGGRGAEGGASRPVDGSGSASGGGDTASDAGWALGASPEVLESWGLSGPGDHGSLILLTSDDADRASRQLEAAAAREEARRIAAANPPAEDPAPAPSDEPARIPQEGDSGISAEDQRKVPPLDPKLARLAADQLRADMRRFPSSGTPTRPGQGNLPSSGETVYGVPSKSQLLEFPGAPPERKAGITWLSWPVPGGRITQLYTTDHHGLDIAGRAGSLIKTVAAGRVAWSGWRTNGGGYQAWVRHSAGVYSAYYHMSELLVRPGQWVPRGKAVGIIGSTGYSSGTHLHLELWRNGVPGTADRRVNPLRYAKP